MFGFGYALVPFYYQICAAWEVNNLDRRASPQKHPVDKSRSVTIELDANAHHMAWRFRPLVNHVTVHPGEIATVEYEVVNAAAVALTGQAVRATGRSSPASISTRSNASASRSRRSRPARCGACRWSS